MNTKIRGVIRGEGSLSHLLGKVRLQKWFVAMPSRVKERITREVTQLVLVRKPRQCNFLEYQGTHGDFVLSNPTAHLSVIA